ncbi:alanine racemase [Pontixanthobacter gangjinensis]|uniref:alanine racemase n=1 Tax=Pontixanthobacter gangjinensis TaxID=1028742 RepID=UPI002E26DE5B
MHTGNLKVQFDGDRLVSNWNALRNIPLAGTTCGAAVKANAYGVGATEVVSRLIKAGCRDFFVATWQEAEEIAALTTDCSVTVLNGVLGHEMELAVSSNAKPMLNSLKQVQRWQPSGKPCDVMINTGMNRLGINCGEVAEIDWSGLEIDVLASHLASADENVSQNAEQLAAFTAIGNSVPHNRKSLANSAGIALGGGYHFDLTRPGLSLYGGIPRAELSDCINPVGSLETRLLQVRQIMAGDHVGYNATFTANGPMTIGIAALGYADGYGRGFSGSGLLSWEDQSLPVLGRVSMDLVALDLAKAPHLKEGDWIGCPLDLPILSEQSDLSQYEVLTSLGARYERCWNN